VPVASRDSGVVVSAFSQATTAVQSEVGGRPAADALERPQ
jgi:hypothetical protein